MNTPPDRWLSMNEAVAYLGSSRESIQRFAKSGALPHGRVGSTFKFKQSDLDAWVMEQGLQRRQVLADRRAAK